MSELDYMLENILREYPITFFCIHGNHEKRPENIKTYKAKKYHDEIVYYEEDYPNILFTKAGEVYNFNNHQVLVIGGAYSVDKYFRKAHGYNWYESEQPNDKTKNKVEKVLKDLDNRVDIILSHTCPYKYLPREMFLDEIEESADYNLWYCGY